MQAIPVYERIVYLFINSSSGGGLGKEIVSLKTKQLILDVPKSEHQRDNKTIVKVLIKIFNLKEASELKTGFQSLSKECKEGPCMVTACGGDGTVMWVVSQLSAFGIKPVDCPLAVIPLGTGNDFSQNLGWGKEQHDLLDNDMKGLKKLVTRWLDATIRSFDIWQMTAEVYQNGKFEKVDGDKTNKEMDYKKFSKDWCNYFSFGIDGKVGYSFDKHRTSSRIGNLIVYGAMGAVKAMTKTPNIGQLVQTLKTTSKNHENELKSQKSQGRIYLGQTHEDQSFQGFDKVIFGEQKNPFHSNQNLLALNINSFMGGVKGIWARAGKVLKDCTDQAQRDDDGKLELMSFSGSLSIGMEKVAGGFAQRVWQGTGPYEIVFKTSDKQKFRTYLQIDGQFVRMTNPKRILITKSKLTQDSKIFVLQRVMNETSKCCC